MRKIEQAYKQARKHERALFVLTENIAATLEKPALERNQRQLEDTWREINRFRPQMHALAKVFKDIETPVRTQMSRKDYLFLRKIKTWSSGFAKRLSKWEEMARCVQRHRKPVRQPLFPELALTRQDELLSRIYTAFHRLANPNNQDIDAKGHGCFADIEFPIQPFDDFMSAAYRISLALNPRRKLRFLDVGSGGGTKVFAAKHYFQQADGLEYDQGYATAAQRMLTTIGISSSTVFHTDALTFEAYSDYDVIYFYRPMQDDPLMRKLEQRIITKARPGTILIAPYETPMARQKGGICSHIEGPVFVTGVAKKEIGRLRINAEMTGFDIVTRSAQWPFDAGYWAPILDTASFTGKKNSKRTYRAENA